MFILHDKNSFADKEKIKAINFIYRKYQKIIIQFFLELYKTT